MEFSSSEKMIMVRVEVPGEPEQRDYKNKQVGQKAGSNVQPEMGHRTVNQKMTDCL